MNKKLVKHQKTIRRGAGRTAIADAARQLFETLEQRVMLSTVTLNAATTYQTLKGFGGDYAEAYFNSVAQDPVGQYTLQHLAPAQVRVPILLQGWAPNSGGSYSDTGEVTQVFQLMQQAQATGAQIIASIWNVPNWMVTNPGSTAERTIASSMYGQASAAIAAWLQQAQTVYGVNVSSVSFNESDGGFDVLFSSAGLDSFIKTAGSQFQTDGLSTKWMVGDTSQVDGSAAYIAPILADPAALPYINAIAVHAWYADQAPASQFTAIANLGKQYNLPIWSTETNFGPDNIGNFNSWNTASAIAQVYVQMLNLADASAIDYWEYQNDQPLVGAFDTPFPSYYVVQQFSAYLTSGFQVVQSTSDDSNIQTVAAQKGSDFTVEALNNNSAITPTTFTNLPNGTYNLITSDASENAVASGPFVVSTGSLTVTLPAGSVNTLTTLPPTDTNPVPTTGAGTGLTAVYFADQTLSTGTLTHLVNPQYSEIDPTLNFNWGQVAPASSLPNGNFSASWTGSVQAQFSQTYTFVTVADSGVRLWVNGVQLVNDWTNNTGDTEQGTIALTAGQKYSITLQYFDVGYGDLSLGWESPSTPLQIIPSTQLYPSTPTGSGTGLLGQYSIDPGGSSNVPPATFATSPTVTRVDPVVDFNWANSSPDPSIPSTYFEAQWTGTIVPQYTGNYTFVTTSDDGANLWVNNAQVINDWKVQQAVTTTSAAVSLVAGQSYNIVLQYFQGTGGAAIDLQWAGPNTALQDIPTAQLSPAAAAPPSPPTVSVAETQSPAVYSLVGGTDDPGVFQFTRTGSNLNQPLTVNYTMGGTAINGSDYAPLSGTVTFATGYSTATATLIPQGNNNPGTMQTATLTVAASANYNIGAASATVSIDEPPAAPLLTAAPGAGQITLSWPTVAGATLYNIYRSTLPGGEGGTPYVSGISTLTYTDPVVTAGTTYYYTVTAMNGQSEGLPSIEQNATPTTAVGTGGGVLVDSDIGGPGVGGAASFANGVYTVSGSGTDIYNAFDEFNFDATAITGNATLVTQVTSQTDSDPWAKAGLMFRDSANGGAANFTVLATPGNGITVQWRTADGGQTTENSLLGGATVIPAWLKITYTNSVFTAYYSVQSTSNPASVTWTQIGPTETIAMSSGLAGLAVTSHDDFVLSTATFANFSITGPGQNTGSPPATPATLAASPANGSVNLIWPSATGATSYTILRGTASGQETTTVATGVLATSFADSSVTNGTPYFYTVEAVNAAGTSAPTAQASANPAAAATWIGSLSDADVGSPGLAGSASLGNGVYTNAGGGSDIWSSFDQFNFDSTPVTGNTVLIAQVTGQSVSDPWAKAGLMFRDSATSAGAANAAIFTTPGNGVIFQWRSADGGQSNFTNIQTGGMLPVWLALVDNVGVFTAYYSLQSTANPAAVVWNQFAASQTIAMSSSVAGLAVSAHNNASLSTATFANFSINGSSGAAAIPTAPASLTATAGAGQIALSWSTVAGATGYDIYRSTTPGGEGTLATYTGITAAGYTDTAVTASSPYYYTVTAVEGGVQSAPSTEATATAAAVAGPTTLTATAATNAVSLIWAAVPGASGYSIYRGTSAGGESATALVSGLTATTYPDTTVTPGTPYYYIVTASVTSGSTSASPEAIAAALPSTPAMLTAAGSAGQIALSWSAVPGATSYDIYRSTTPGGEGTLATYTGLTAAGYTDTAVTASTPYYYTVTAVEGGVQSAQSTEATASAAAVAGPATLAAAPAVNAVNLSWAAIPGASGYSIYRGISAGGESATALVSGLTATTYPDSTVTPGTSYFYFVTAAVTSGATAASPEANAAAIPATPTSLAAAGGIAQIVLSWSSVPGATSYDLYRSTTPGGEGTLATYAGITAAGYADTSLSAGTPYYYTVTAVEGGVQSGPTTEATASATATTGPTTLTAIAAANAINLSWAAVTNATGYTIYRGTSPGQESGMPLASGLTATTYPDSTVTPGTTYYYIVTASMISGPSTPSPEANAAALPSTPATLAATGNAGQIALSWSTVAGATSYDIYRSLTPGGEGTIATYTGITAAGYTDTAVTTTTPYYYTVTAVEGGVQSAPSTEATASATAITGPATLTATAAANTINLSWAPVAGASGYSVYRGTSAGQESGTPLVGGLSATTYPDSAAIPGTTYYYFVTASVSSGSTSASPEALAAALPSTPATFAAAGGVGQIALSWSAVTGATSYDIYRSTTSGGEGTIATYTGITTTAYTDTAVTASTPYFYTVTAVEGGVQSAPSTQATASASAASIGALTDADIGGPASAGSASFANGLYTVSGGGADFYGNADQFNFDYTAVAATNVTLVTQVDSQTNSNSWAKAGLMFRDSTAPGGAEFAVVDTPGNGVELQWRLADGSATTYTTALSGNAVPSWLEIVRVGNVFTGYYSTQTTTNPAAVNWTMIGSSQTITMNSALAGLAVTAHNNATLSTATFGNFSLTTATVATTSNPTLSDADIGSPAKAGSASLANSVYTVSGGGSDIYGAADQFNFDSTTVSGNTTAIVQVNSQTAADPWAKAGLMFRDSTAAGAAEFSVFATPGNGVEMQYRTADGAATTFATALSGNAVPCWLEIVRVGNVFTAYYSTQSTTNPANVTWTQIGSPQTIASMPTGALVGLAVTPHNNASLSTATFGNLTISSTGGSSNAPIGPATLTATPSANTIALSWAAVAGASGYSIYRGTSLGGESGTPLIGGLTTATYSDSSATPGTTYYYVVTASVSSGTTSASPEAHAAALPSTPATLVVTGGIGQIALSWSAVNGATSYDIYRSTISGSEGTLATYTGITATGYTDTAVTTTTPYYYTITSVEGGVQSAQSTQATASATAPAPPSAPATFAAAGGVGQIVLSWSAVNGATSYDIYRSTTSGGEGTIATYTSITATAYTDTAVTASTPYFYTVTAVEGGVQSAPSTQATASASAASIGALTDADIGGPATAGSASFANGLYTVSGGGADFYGNADQFNFDYTAVAATNVTLVTQVDSQTNSNSWAKAGLMFRDSTAPGGAEFAVVDTPGNGVELQWRLADGAATTYTTALSGNAVPSWLEIVRVGNVFTGYYSTQTTTNPATVNWTMIGSSQTITMNSALAGLAVTAHNNATLSTATFGNFSLTTATVATTSNPTLSDADIGSPAKAGSASLANSVYTVSGGGSDIYGNSDQFNFDSTTVSGNTTAIVQVNSQTAADPWAKAGLMFRDSTAAGAAEFSVFATPGNGVEMQYRTADGAATTFATALSGNAVPCWLEIVRVSNVFTAYYSTQSTTNPANVTWTQIGSPQTIASMPTSALVGLAVTPHNNASLSTATFSNLSV